MAWLPDRKVLAGGITGIVAWGIILGAMKLGYPVDIATAGTLAAFAMTAISYVVPSSVKDVLAKVDAKIISLAVEQKPETIAANVAAIDRNAAIPLKKAA